MEDYDKTIRYALLYTGMQISYWMDYVSKLPVSDFRWNKITS